MFSLPFRENRPSLEMKLRFFSKRDKDPDSVFFGRECFFVSWQTAGRVVSIFAGQKPGKDSPEMDRNRRDDGGCVGVFSCFRCLPP